MSKEKNVTVTYPAGHSYNFEYIHDEDMFCPQCGLKDVWFDGGAGDFYEGPTHICISCETSFTIPRMIPSSNEDKQIIEQIKSE